MMHPTCFNSSLSLRCRASRSLYFDDPTYFSDARFDTNRLLISSSFGTSCCCCCCAVNCNSIYNSLPRTNPSFLCNGLRQSTLIQFQPSRRLLVHGRSRQLCDSGSSDCDSDRRCYYKKILSLKDRRKLGEGRYACWSYDNRKNEASFSDESDGDCVDEVELLLDLLSEGVRVESVGVSVSGRKRIQKKDSSNVSCNKRTVKRDLTCDSKAEENRKLSNERRTFVNEVNHERKKQGSSGSSYYSVSSTGEYDNDNDNDFGSENDVVIELDNDYVVKGESSSEYKDDQKIDEEVVENVERKQEFGKKQSEVKKNTVESYYGNEEWRKKSEKKLNVESSQSQHAERYSQHNEFQSGMKNKNSRTQKVYSDTENKLVTSVQDFTRQNEYKKQSNQNVISEASTKRYSQHHSEKSDRITDQSQSGMENKNSSIQNLYSDTGNKLVTSVQELTSQHKEETADFTRQNEYKKQSNQSVILEASENYNFDKRMASSSSSSFETRMKNREEKSTEVSNQFESQREEKLQRVDQLISSKESRVKSQQYSETSDTRFTNIENTSVSKKQELHLESSSSSSQVVGPTESTKTGRKTTKASSFHVGMPKESSSSYKALKLNPESTFQETVDHITSADEQLKSAGQYVGEFVEKAKHQLSISEDDEQQNGSGNNDEKDGSKGPSDEMWHESGALVNTSSDEFVKRSGRSLWNVIGDVVRLRWGPSRSETHTPKSGSERWFSGHEPDDSSRKDVSTPSSSKGKQDSPLLSSSNTNQGSSSKSMSPLVIEEPSIPVPAIRMRRSPVDQTVSKPLTEVPHTDASGSGKMVTVEQPVSFRRKLARIDQVSKDRFDEWEEAYTIEAKERKIDEFFMREALSEAKKAADIWEVPVGAVLVQDGKIIARGYNLVEELRDSTAHAEMVCIREASNKLHSWRLSGTTLYVTLEPCPMCAGAILQARVDTVVWGAPNKLLGADGSWIRLFPDGDGGNGSDKPPAPVHPFHPNMKVRRGVLSSECADVMQQFFQLRRKKKDKKPEAEPPSPPQPSCLPIAQHHNSKFVTKLQDAFGIMFCL